MKISFAPPRIDEKIINSVTEALKSGWITTGPRTKLFEKKLAEYCGIKNVVCLNSATAGLELILRWFGVQEGDEVILPAYTYSATANVVIHCGATPVFVDVNNDFSISIEKISKVITDRTKVIMPVDFGGLPCDYDAINSLVNSDSVLSMFNPQTENQKKLNRILVLSDAAHSIGGKYKGRRAGALTDVSVFSFHAVKNLTTAEGGAIMLNLPYPFDNEDIYKEIVIKSLHGQTKDALSKTKPGAWRYDIVEAGYKFNMTDIQAAIGLVELERYELETLPARKFICEYYRQKLSGFEWADLPIQMDGYRESSYHLFPLRINSVSEDERDRIIALISEKEIAVNVHFIPIPMMSFYKNKGYDISDYPQTYNYYSREISLPVYYGLKTDEMDFLVENLKECVESVLNAR